MKAKRVRELMTTDVIKLDKQQAIPLAQELMRMMHVRHLPVVGDDDELVGMVTHRSLLSAQVELLSQMAGGDDAERELSIPVAKVMTAEVQTVGPDAPVSEALKKMLDARQGVVVVVEGKRIVGVLTSQDFLKLMLEEPEPALPAVDELAKLAAHEAVAAITRTTARSENTAPRWLVWLLAALVAVLAATLLALRSSPSSGPGERQASLPDALEGIVADGGSSELAQVSTRHPASTRPRHSAKSQARSEALDASTELPLLDTRPLISPDDQLPLPEDVARGRTPAKKHWIPERLNPARR